MLSDKEKNVTFFNITSMERFHSRGHEPYKSIDKKRKVLHKKRVQLLQNWFGTPTWPPFNCFGATPWRM